MSYLGQRPNASDKVIGRMINTRRNEDGGVRR